MIGQTISHYRIEEKLGEGGMGVVYRAEDTRLGRTVALKALAAAYARDPARRERFKQEARAAAALSHPGIAAVYELEEVGDSLYIVYEYIPGPNLRSLVRRGGLDLEILLDIATGIAQALAAAHERGVVHRDLKPENVARTPEGQTKILDFGLARFASPALDTATASTRLTEPGMMVGTVAYMAPEQLEGKEADTRSDIFAFGALLYELATGTHPFKGATPASTIARILTAEPAPLVRLNPLSPPELDRIVRKCLRKRPGERYQSTRDLAVDLEQLRRESGERHPVAGAAAGKRGAGTGLGVEEGEPALLARLFSVWGLTPRRWWELDTLAGLIVFYPLMIYFAWKVKEWEQEPWAFFSILVYVVAPFSLRVFLLSTAAFNPAALPREVRRLAPWLMFAHLMLFVGVLTGAGVMLPPHTGFAALLVGFVVAGLVAVLIIHPAINRAAFPEIGAKETPAPPGLAECRRMGWIQAIYLLPFGFFMLVVPISIGQAIAGADPQPFALFMVIVPASIAEAIGKADKAVLGGMIGFWAVVLAFGILMGRSMLALREGNRQGVSVFYRWFPVFFLADLLAVALLVGMLAGMRILAVGLLVLPVLLYLPFYQRQLARKLLESAGNRK
ncbi:MAG: serine/threonine-protein kinase [Terriglobia bacterium]